MWVSKKEFNRLARRVAALENETELETSAVRSWHSTRSPFGITCDYFPVPVKDVLCKLLDHLDLTVNYEPARGASCSLIEKKDD